MEFVTMMPPGPTSHVHIGPVLLTAEADGSFKVPAALVGEAMALGFATQGEKPTARRKG